MDRRLDSGCVDRALRHVARFAGGKGLAFAVFTLLAMPAAHSAGFDCSKAGSTAEKLVCGDTLLSEYDAALADSYKAALAISRAPQVLRREQRAWLKRRDACVDANCMRAAYRRRLAEIANRDSIPRDGEFWPVDPGPAKQDPESARVAQALAGDGRSAEGSEFLDLGDGAYLVTTDTVHRASGLFYVVARRDLSLVEKLAGPFVKLRQTRELRDGARLFLFDAGGHGFDALTAVVVTDPQVMPNVTQLAIGLYDMVDGGCGSGDPRPLEVARDISSFDIRDIDGDGVVDIAVRLTETDCRTGKATERVVQYVYSEGKYVERGPVRD